MSCVWTFPLAPSCTGFPELKCPFALNSSWIDPHTHKRNSRSHVQYRSLKRSGGEKMTCAFSSFSGLPQQERRSRCQQSGQPGQGVRRQVQTHSEEQNGQELRETQLRRPHKCNSSNTMTLLFFFSFFLQIHVIFIPPPPLIWIVRNLPFNCFHRSFRRDCCKHSLTGWYHGSCSILYNKKTNRCLIILGHVSVCGIAVKLINQINGVVLSVSRSSLSFSESRTLMM